MEACQYFYSFLLGKWTIWSYLNSYLLPKKKKRLCLKEPLSLGTIQRWMYFVAQRLWLNEGIPCFLSRTIANAGVISASMVREDQSLLSPSALEWRDRTLGSLSWFTSDCRVIYLTYCAAPTIAKEKNNGEVGVYHLDHISCLRHSTCLFLASPSSSLFLVSFSSFYCPVSSPLPGSLRSPSLLHSQNVLEHMSLSVAAPHVQQREYQGSPHPAFLPSKVNFSWKNINSLSFYSLAQLVYPQIPLWSLSVLGTESWRMKVGRNLNLSLKKLN